MSFSNLLVVGLLALGATSTRQGSTDAVTPTSVAPRPATEEPFPLETTTLKNDGASYYIEGRVRIPHNQTVVSLRHMSLTGRGTHPVLEVSGKLEIKAATGGRSKIRNLTIEVMPDCVDLLVTEAIFSDGGGVRSSPDGPADTEIYLQNHDAAYNILFADGAVKTYADAVRSLKRTLQQYALDPIYQRQPASAVSYEVFEKIFDGQYMMD